MYQYKDGPNTGLSSGPTGQPIYSGETTTFTGFHTKNFSNDTVADAGVWAPFTWVTLSNGTHEALTWDSTQHGWHTPNFIGGNGPTGKSLSLTAKFPSGSTTIAAHPLRAATSLTAQVRRSTRSTPQRFSRQLGVKVMVELR
jgi:hypothetical protein